MEHRRSDLRRPTGRRCPALVRLVFLAVAGVPLPCPTSARAEAASAPDSARIAWVQFELRHFDDVRIVTGGAKILAQGPVVSSDGLRISDSGGWTWTPSKERLVPWAEIEAIQARRGASGTPVLLGALAGLAIGLTISMAGALGEVFTFGHSKHNSDTPILLGVAGGATLGWLIDRPGPWQPVYP